MGIEYAGPVRRLDLSQRQPPSRERVRSGAHHQQEITPEFTVGSTCSSIRCYKPANNKHPMFGALHAEAARVVVGNEDWVFGSVGHQFGRCGHTRRSNTTLTVLLLRSTATSSRDASGGKIVRFTLKNSPSLVISRISPGLGSDSINFSRVAAFMPKNSMLPTRYCTC